MRTVLALMNRNRKLFFKDKGMLFTSMITPVILIVLYATFLAKAFKDSFTAAIPDMITISDKLREYEKSLDILGERNSYSKTDPDVDRFSIPF